MPKVKRCRTTVPGHFRGVVRRRASSKLKIKRKTLFVCSGSSGISTSDTSYWYAHICRHLVKFLFTGRNVLDAFLMRADENQVTKIYILKYIHYAYRTAA